MKRLTAVLLLVVMIFSLVACGVINNASSNDISIDNHALEKILNDVFGDFDSTSKKLTEKLGDIKTSIGNTYEGYNNNIALIDGYYNVCLEEASELYQRTRENSVTYYKSVASTVDHDNSDALKDAIELFYEIIYKDAFDGLYEAIYKGAFDDLYDTYYKGIIEDAKDSMEYKDWLDIRTAFYSDWLDARSDFYGDWLDARSDIYSDYLDIRSKFIYNDNFNVDDILNSEQKEDGSATAPESDENENDVSEPSYIINYNDAESFESALNNDKSTKGKIVQFYVKEYAPDSILGINCHAGEHLNFLFENELNVKKGDTIVVRITEEPSKVFLVDSWKVPCEFLELVKSEEESTSDTESNHESKEPETTEITLTMGADDFKGMYYKDAEQKFRNMGFYDFEYETVDTTNETSADTICYIEITEFIFGNSDFKKGDTFDAGSTITLYSYKYKEPEKPKPVYYSTNDLETAKKGNTGVFAYIRTGNFYDVYYIIDFDEGYVYYFLEGDGNDWCDKLKIDSGDLNEYVSFTYHMGDDIWSERLHFKYVNAPSILIWNGANGDYYEFSPTDLNDALSIRNTKAIKER